MTENNTDVIVRALCPDSLEVRDSDEGRRVCGIVFMNPVAERCWLGRIHASRLNLFKKTPPGGPINPAVANDRCRMAAFQRGLLTGQNLLAAEPDRFGRAGFIHPAIVIL